MRPPSQLQISLIAATAALLASAADARTVSIQFSAANFSNPLTIDNTYFPLVPGTTFTYEVVEHDKANYCTDVTGLGPEIVIGTGSPGADQLRSRLTGPVGRPRRRSAA